MLPKAHERIIWAADWSPSAALFATGSRDKSFKLWAFDPHAPCMPQACAGAAQGLHAPVTALAFAPPATAEPAAEQPQCRNPTQGEDLLAVGYEDGALELFSVTGGSAGGSMRVEKARRPMPLLD